MHAASQWRTTLHLPPPRSCPDLLIDYMLHAANSKKELLDLEEGINYMLHATNSKKNSLIWGKELTALRFLEREPAKHFRHSTPKLPPVAILLGKTDDIIHALLCDQRE